MFTRRAQTLLEYVLVISLVAIALSAMQIYMRRAIQAGIKVVVDDFGTQEGSEQDLLSGTLMGSTSTLESSAKKTRQESASTIKTSFTPNLEVEPGKPKWTTMTTGDSTSWSNWKEK